MRLRPILLRLLMIVALVANAGGNAFAATRMLIQHASADQSALAAEAIDVQVAAPPCHEQAGATVAGTVLPTGPASGHASPDHGTPDCCADATCLCPCLQQAPALAALVGAVPALRERAIRDLGGLHMGHAAPALPHLIRPPIV